MAKIVIIGSGGREHALGWSSGLSPDVTEVIYVSGNAGTARERKSRNVKFDVKPSNFQALFDLVQSEHVSQVIVGPEQPLVDGIVDFFNARGYLDIFGPTAKAAQIESDKFFSYDVMEHANVPQAFGIQCIGLEQAVQAIMTKQFDTSKGIVIKARGLTAGKGVLVCDSIDEALMNIGAHISRYGEYNLISERLFGDEYSIFGISDGERVTPIEISIQDHKRLLDGDLGLNTGGMGAYGPTKFADNSKVRYLAENYMTKVVQQMKGRGIIYKGFLYAGFIGNSIPKVLEFNCRYGDPEAQPSVMMMEGSLHPVIAGALGGNNVDITFKTGSSCCVVMAANGYPGEYLKRFPIGGLEEVSEMPGVKVFHAGTSDGDSREIISVGGRVLGVTAYAPEGLARARELAYQAIDLIGDRTRKLNGDKEMLIFRTDIGMKGLN